MSTRSPAFVRAWLLAILLAFLAASFIARPTAAYAGAGNRTIRLGDGASLVVGRGAKVEVLRQSSRVGRPAPDDRRFGSRVRLAIRSGGGSATLRFALPKSARSKPLDVVEATYLVRGWRDGGHRWVAVPSRVNKARTVMSVRLQRRGVSARASVSLPPLYITGPMSLEAAQRTLENLLVLGGQRASAQPQCAGRGPKPEWASVSGPGEPLRYCARGEGDVAAVELVNNRPYGVILRYGTPVTFGWSDKGFGLPALIGTAGDLATDGLYIPGRSSASVGIPHDFSGERTFTAAPTNATIFLDVLEDFTGVGGDILVKVLKKPECKTKLEWLLTNDLGITDFDAQVDLVKEAIGAALDCVPAAIAALKELKVPSGILNRAKVAAAAVGRVLRKLALPVLAARYAQIAGDAALGKYMYFTVKATPLLQGGGRTPRLTISGSCTTDGGTLTSTSSGFTPGGTATISAWRPDGSVYTGITATSRVRDDGSIAWLWPCAGDPAGTYATEARDDATGRTTGRVSFTIGAGSSVDPPRRVAAYDNYGPATAGRAMCRGNPGRPESMPGGTATQTFSVPAGVAALDTAMVQIDPDSRVTAHADLWVDGALRASTTAAAAGDTTFSFGRVAVTPGDSVSLSIRFTASFGKIITVYTAAVVGGTFTASNSCSDGAPSLSSANGLRAVVSGWSS